MSSKVTVNIGSEPIVIPDTDIPDADTPETIVPDTGMFSTGQISDSSTYTTVLPIIGASIITLTLLAIVIRLCIKRIKDKRHSSNFKIHNTGRSLLRLTSIALIVTISALAFINYNANNKKQVEALETRDSNSLSITTEDINIKVVMEDEPVFATAKNTVTVNTATAGGYTLIAYIDSSTTDLTNEAGTNATAKITGLESSYPQSLAENTWGIALSSPEDQNTPIFRGLPTNEEEAMVVGVSGSDVTNADDTTELYYATYVTPDLEEGTYTGATINYIAIANPTSETVTVRYHDTDNSVNTVVYGRDCAMAYIGNNCRKAYAGESTTINAADGYIDYLPSYSYFTNLEGSLNPVTYEGADAIKITIDYHGENEYYVVILKGAYPTMTSLITKIQEIENNGDNIEDWIIQIFAPDMVNETNDSLKEFYHSGDSFTIISIPSRTADYSNFNYVVTPILMNKPSGFNTTETTICALVDNDDAFSELWGNNEIDFRMNRPITFPDANKLRVETTYNFPSGNIGFFRLNTIEGNWSGMSEPNNYREITSFYEEDNTGIDIYDYDGNTITFYHYGYIYGNNNDGYGFSAKIYPIYNNDTEDTIPVQTCSLINKSGKYVKSNDPDFIYWVTLDENVLEFGNEFFVKDFVENQFNEYYSGNTLDLYPHTTK